MWFLIGLSIVLLILLVAHLKFSRLQTDKIEEDSENIYPLWELLFLTIPLSGII